MSEASDSLGPGLLAVAQLGALLMARILPMVALTPLFGGTSAPRRFRFGVAILLTGAMLPLVLPQAAGPIPAGRFAELLLKETLVGLTLSLFVTVMFETFAYFGSLVDTARGAAFATVLDPMSRRQQAVLGTFFLNVSLVLFYAAGGHRLLLGSFAESLGVIPPLDPAAAGLMDTQASMGAIGLVADMIVIAFRLAAPVIVAMLLIDVMMGVINRTAPQFQVFFLGFVVKAPMGLLIVLASAALTFDSVLGEFVQRIREGATGILP